MPPVTATCLGYPRIGARRELERALGSFWAGRTAPGDLDHVAGELREQHWASMRAAGLDELPSNDFSLFDSMLDMSVAVGAIPARFHALMDPLWRYFAMARGSCDGRRGIAGAAMEARPWFDTRYHHVVPEIQPGQAFALDPSKILRELAHARALGHETRPVVPGPVTFLMASKSTAAPTSPAHPLDEIEGLLNVYVQLLACLARDGVSWVQLDEPCLVLDLDERAQAAYRRAFQCLLGATHRPRLLVATFFGQLGSNWRLLRAAPLDALHIDLVSAPEQLEVALKSVAAPTRLSLGLVDGRNVWRTDLDAAHRLLRRAVASLGAERVTVATSCSLLHVPLDLTLERRLEPELEGCLAFARQKLDEVVALASAAETDAPDLPAFKASRAAIAARCSSAGVHHPHVPARLTGIDSEPRARTRHTTSRLARQAARLGLPLLPTASLDYFQPNGGLHAVRTRSFAGEQPTDAQEAAERAHVQSWIARQEALGLDVLTAGALDGDGVQYFAERLTGFASTDHGYVQSYGFRCIRPPIIWGDISRPAPMTVEWARYAQTLTERPLAGTLLGPMTLLRWSFVRDDQPLRETCIQLALALRDEARDLEATGLAIIALDEPALLEGLVPEHAGNAAYLTLATAAFNVVSAGVRDETQVHLLVGSPRLPAHALAVLRALDADVYGIDASTPAGDLATLAGLDRACEIALGTIDAESPDLPTTSELLELVERAQRALPGRQLWLRLGRAALARRGTLAVHDGGGSPGNPRTLGMRAR